MRFAADIVNYVALMLKRCLKQVKHLLVPILYQIKNLLVETSS